MDFQDVVRRRPDGAAVHRRPGAAAQPGPDPGQRGPRPVGRVLPGQAFLVLTGDDLPRFWAIAGEATRPSVHDAPLLIIPLSCQRMYINAYVRRDPGWADPGRWPMPWWHLDTAMTALLILLTAVDEGLAAVYFGIVDHETRALRAELGSRMTTSPSGPSPSGTTPKPDGPASPPAAGPSPR